MKLGIFGGSFNPPHIGHINICKCFKEGVELDRVIVMPVNLPPHKSACEGASAASRMEMARLSFENINEGITVSDYEITKEGKSYTADTLKHFKSLGYDDIYFLCGTDMLLTLDTWYHPEIIFECATIVYMRRENDCELAHQIEIKKSEYFSRYGAKIIELDGNVLPISSTQIRDGIKAGEDVGNYLKKEVSDYIIANGLYK